MNILPQIEVSKDCPGETIFWIPNRLHPNESDEEYAKRFGVIYGFWFKEGIGAEGAD